MGEQKTEAVRVPMEAHDDILKEVDQTVPATLQPLRRACYAYGQEALIRAELDEAEDEELAALRAWAQQGFDKMGQGDAGREMLDRLKMTAEAFGRRRREERVSEDLPVLRGIDED